MPCLASLRSAGRLEASPAACPMRARTTRTPLMRRARAGTGKTVGSRSEARQEQQPAEPEREQEQRPAAQQPQRKQGGSGGGGGGKEFDDLLSRMMPQRAGDAADITLMLLSTCALVALSMQVYRGYLLASMYAAERF